MRSTVKPGPNTSRRFNEIITAEAGRYPDRLLPFGTIPLQDPRRAAEEFGLRGARAGDGRCADRNHR